MRGNVQMFNYDCKNIQVNLLGSLNEVPLKHGGIVTKLTKQETEHNVVYRVSLHDATKFIASVKPHLRDCDHRTKGLIKPNKALDMIGFGK
ncbi:hypothetical protein CHS0354_002196 [Potamilus streckersoni]|uniref:Uncharacterized protein n=1 Tax=Potamilus streckersoni TaxID=2493646 RepID=A0AAE0RS45_9BIVA|nr:hypothetical protein CHS0354_002196 [Potamilus streckersoni]